MLPSQASSVPCERLFLGTKQIADEHQSWLGDTVFEDLALMKSAWGPELYDFAAWNAAQVKEVMLDYEQLLLDDVDSMEWDKELHSEFDGFELEIYSFFVCTVPIRPVSTGHQLVSTVTG